MPITIGTVYSTTVANSTANSATWTITDISVPSDATACILIFMGGYFYNDRDSIDIANFDGDADKHFSVIAQATDGDEGLVGAYKLLYGQTGFPIRGSTGNTFTGSFNALVEYGGSRILLFFLSGTVTDEDFIIGSDYHDSGGSGSSWTSDSLGSVGASDLSFIAGAHYTTTKPNAAPAGSGQTQIDSATFGSASSAAGYEFGEATPTITIQVNNYAGAVAFAVKAAASKAIPPSILSRQRDAFHHMIIR
jgi:hypothetical protein